MIQKLTESEESKLQIQSDAKQMADELVAQYNRFQTEQAELKSSLEKEHSNQSKEKAEQFESEKNTLLQNFSEKYQKLEGTKEEPITKHQPPKLLLVPLLGKPTSIIELIGTRENFTIEVKF